MIPSSSFSHRLAVIADLAELRVLMMLAIRHLVGAYLDAARLDASFEIMGVDTQLIEDGTYFAVECQGRIVGCGGWSRRATLFGGDHSGGRDARFLDPAAEPARVRAMYTHPDFARRGIGRLVLSLCEAALRERVFGHSSSLQPSPVNRFTAPVASPSSSESRCPHPKASPSRALA